jgi:hypothetical protein
VNALFTCLAVAVALMGILAIAGGATIVMILWRGPKLLFSVRSRSPWQRQAEPAHRPQLADSLEPVKCTHCSGGTQWHNPATAIWGPIPEPLLYRVRAADGDFDCRPPLHTGLRSCTNCAGFGSIYRDISAYQDD